MIMTMKNNENTILLKRHSFDPDDDWPASGRLCHVTKWDVKLIPNFIGLKALNKQKMT